MVEISPAGSETTDGTARDALREARAPLCASWPEPGQPRNRTVVECSSGYSPYAFARNNKFPG